MIGVGGNALNIRLASSYGLPASLPGSIQDLNLQMPKLPPGQTMNSVSVTPSGVVSHVRGHACRSAPDKPLATITMPLSGLFLGGGAARLHRATDGALQHAV
jgi:hypothetical protein